MKARIVYGTRKSKDRYYIDEKEVTREEFDAAFPNRVDQLLKTGQMLPAHTTTCWPMISEAAAIHPEQIAEATEWNKKMGDHVKYTSTGEAIFTSRRQRKEHLKNIRLRDKNAGYSD